MKGFVTNIEEEVLTNDNFRKVLYTDERVQLVVMSLLPSEEIGSEMHNLDQFIRVEEGRGKVVMNDDEQDFEEGMAIIIPAGTMHNIINMSPHNPLKLYTLYAPPNHTPGTVHKTKAEAEGAEQH